MHGFHKIKMFTHRCFLWKEILCYRPAQNESIISTNTKSYHYCQDVHEREEGESEDDGVGEVGEAQGVGDGSETGDGDCETSSEAPDGEEDDNESKQEITSILYQVGIKQGIFQTWKK